MVAAYGVPLEELVADLLKSVGPVHYERKDLRIPHPVNKAALTRKLCEDPPGDLGGVRVREVRSLDGIKYILADDSWLLIRPSGTEPVLRVYAEAREPRMIEVLLSFGQKVAQDAI
jgi:phosphomannomutase